jgi:hypothetical protein
MEDPLRPGAFLFSNKWISTVRSLPETGMGYAVVKIVLSDGREFDQAVVDSGYLLLVRGLPIVPFSEGEIAQIIATHEKWDWRTEQ